MPLMHSESRLIHTQATPLFERRTNPNALHFELRHKAIIDRFGCHPRRNATLSLPRHGTRAGLFANPWRIFFKALKAATVRVQRAFGLSNLIATNVLCTSTIAYFFIKTLCTARARRQPIIPAHA